MSGLTGALELLRWKARPVMVSGTTRTNRSFLPLSQGWRGSCTVSISSEVRAMVVACPFTTTLHTMVSSSPAALSAPESLLRSGYSPSASKATRAFSAACDLVPSEVRKMIVP